MSQRLYFIALKQADKLNVAPAGYTEAGAPHVPVHHRSIKLEFMKTAFSAVVLL